MFKKVVLSLLLTTFLSMPAAYAGDSKDPEQMMRTADTLVITGYALDILGGAAAIGGGAYAAANSNRRLTGAIIAASGAGLGLVGGVLTIIGYHKRSKAEQMSSLSPIIDTNSGQYGLRYSLLF